MISKRRKLCCAQGVVTCLEGYESILMPDGGHSRLYSAIRVARETLAFYTCTNLVSRERLRVCVQDLREVESSAAMLDQIPVGSPMQRGISMALHIGSAALADADPNPRHVLLEAQALYLEVLP